MSTAADDNLADELAHQRLGMPWTDFYLILAVSREGSVAKACSLLGMTHSTLLRKLDQIETRLKVRLFERVRGRYTLTPAGHEIEQAALAFEPIAWNAQTRILGQDLQPTGEVRVSVAAILIEHLLPPVLTQFAAAFPDVRIELTAAREHVSLRQREVDVAIRIADTVPDWLIGRRLTELQFKVYGLRQGTIQPTLRKVGDLANVRRWIGFERDARDLKSDRWMAAEVPDTSIILRVDSFSHALTMVRAGLGIAILPTFLENYVPDLQPLSAPIAALKTPLWLITHPELKNTMRVKVLMRAFGPALASAAQGGSSR